MAANPVPQGNGEPEANIVEDEGEATGQEHGHHEHVPAIPVPREDTADERDGVDQLERDFFAAFSEVFAEVCRGDLAAGTTGPALAGAPEKKSGNGS